MRRELSRVSSGIQCIQNKTRRAQCASRTKQGLFYVARVQHVAAGDSRETIFSVHANIRGAFGAGKQHSSNNTTQYDLSLLIYLFDGIRFSKFSTTIETMLELFQFSMCGSI